MDFCSQRSQLPSTAVSKQCLRFLNERSLFFNLIYKSTGLDMIRSYIRTKWTH